MIKEFKTFITKGNVVDMAVGVIIGGAFSKIVTSLVDNVFTPLIGIVLGGLDFSNLSITFRNSKIMYGAFIQSIIDFLIIGLCLFVIVKVLNKISLKKKKEEVKKEVEKSEELKVLEEIRDSLRK